MIAVMGSDRKQEVGQNVMRWGYAVARFGARLTLTHVNFGLKKESVVKILWVTHRGHGLTPVRLFPKGAL